MSVFVFMINISLVFINIESDIHFIFRMLRIIISIFTGSINIKKPQKTTASSSNRC